MKLSLILTITAILGLVLILAITILYTVDIVSFENYTMMLLGFTVVWFVGILMANWVKNH